LYVNRGDLLWITNIFLLAAVVLYGYYGLFTPQGMSYVYRNWDGPGYLVVAKTMYDVDLINKINPFPFLKATHYSFQFPLYPVMIRMFSFIGWNESMIFSSTFSALLFSLALYFLVKEVFPKANARMVAVLSIFYTPRWFIVNHVGSTEPLMVFLITLFMIFYLKKRFVWSAVALALAQLTKPQGIVFFVGIALYYAARIVVSLFRKKSPLPLIREFVPYLIVPLALCGIFALYQYRFGNFFVFMGNEALPTLQWPPLKVLLSPTIFYFNVGFFTGWKEIIVITYVLYFIPIMILFEKKLQFFGVVALTYFLPVLLFNQADMPRFIIPMMPFAFLGYAEGLSNKSIYRGLLLCLPMVFLYAIGYINYNLAPL
jgi:Gpi18-like mannosyltransferase